MEIAMQLDNRLDDARLFSTEKQRAVFGIRVMTWWKRASGSVRDADRPISKVFGFSGYWNRDRRPSRQPVCGWGRGSGRVRRDGDTIPPSAGADLFF